MSLLSCFIFDHKTLQKKMEVSAYNILVSNLFKPMPESSNTSQQVLPVVANSTVFYLKRRIIFGEI